MLTLSQTETPKVGETWLCDVTGRVDWSPGDLSDRVLERVRITWSCSAGRVFEGLVIRPKKVDVKVPLYRGLMRERVS